MGHFLLFFCPAAAVSRQCIDSRACYDMFLSCPRACEWEAHFVRLGMYEKNDTYWLKTLEIQELTA
ncbi:hypothetical protein K440DRAFT_635259 [Wilcoxina mikolae CBS 423.85]|nr:hypothetical protein K440DRAFT_635259 [Wilcoxina mikolae CBS 423.85]